MAYVTVPKDLTKVKNKVAFNLTKRQIVCMAIAAAFGIPFFFLTRDYLGITNAATGMVLLMVPAFLFGMYEKDMVPAFLFGMYEKDGMPLEKILLNIITVRFRRPHVRRYETENLYMQEEKTDEKDNHKASGRPKGGHPRNA